MVVGHLHLFFEVMSLQVLCTLCSWVGGFLLLSYMNSLCVLDIRSLRVIWFANIFSLPMACLLILLIIFCAARKINVVPLVYLYFYYHYIWCYVQEIIIKTDAKKLFPCFLLGVLQFQISHLNLPSHLSWFLYLV